MSRCRKRCGLACSQTSHAGLPISLCASPVRAEVLEHIISNAIKTVFEEYVEQHGLSEIAEIFGRGVRIEVGDLLRSSDYAERLSNVPDVWNKAFEVNAAEDVAVRASCVEFILAGLHATDRISRHQQYGTIDYQIPE